MRIFIQSFALTLLILLQGCLKITRDPLVPPEESIAEITTFGITLSTEDRPFPATTDVQFFQDATSYIHAQNLLWYFTPLSSYSEIEDGLITNLPVENFSYTYGFFINEGGSYIEIPSTDGFDINHSPASYPGDANIQEFPEEFLVIGNYVLEAPIVRIPITATHIEVFLNIAGSTERIAVSKVALENLKAWRDYIAPAFGEAMQ